MATTLIDLTGKTFGLWNVIERGPNTKQGKPRWWCQCACDTLRLVSTSHLTRKCTPSRDCGCTRTKLGRPIEFHGSTHTPEYVIWVDMIERCINPKQKSYSRYGGRGITVCSEWSKSFLAFFADMGKRPSPKHMLDRLDNSLGYCKENCRWTTPDIQYRNRRSNRWLTLHGRTQCLIDWSRDTGIERRTIQRRIDLLGWSMERALTTPPRITKRSIV